MSTIPISVTEEQFDAHIRPLLRTAKRGFVCQIALVKVFNYILYRLHTGCQWAQLPIAPSRKDPEKRTELASGLLSLPEVERRWQSSAGLGTKHSNDSGRPRPVTVELGRLARHSQERRRKCRLPAPKTREDFQYPAHCRRSRLYPGFDRDCGGQPS